jgi:hypothetical protein
MLRRSVRFGFLSFMLTCTCLVPFRAQAQKTDQPEPGAASLPYLQGCGFLTFLSHELGSA